MNDRLILGAASPKLHVLAAIIGVVCLLTILRMVRRQHSRAKYSLLWIATGVAFVVLGAAPGLLDWAAREAGVAYPPELLFLVGIIFLVLVAVHLSWEMSRLEDNTRVLAEELALLRTELEGRRVSAITPTGAAGPVSSRAWGHQPHARP
jgi:hypothetical protein